LPLESTKDEPAPEPRYYEKRPQTSSTFGLCFWTRAQPDSLTRTEVR